LVRQRDNRSNLDGAEFNELLNQFVIPLNSTPHYPPLMGR